MLGGRRLVISVTFTLAWLGFASPRPAAPSRAAVKSTPPANLPTGSVGENALQMIANANDDARAARLAKKMYSATANDGQSKYDDKSLLRIAATTTPQESKVQPPGAKTTPGISKDASKGGVAPSAKTVLENNERKQQESAQALPLEKAPELKSQSVLQMLEGHETEVKIGLIIAAFAFVLGWICGVGYYERRERKWRHKLRF